ncbi:MAG: hypothetical protein WBG71_00435 [Leeuwenhoekiella sp.]
MKKILISLAVLAFCAVTTSAQDIAENALGLRLGDDGGLGTEVSYQRALGGNNRLEVDLGWSNGKNTDSFALTGLYQWVWNIDAGFNWYAGVGGGLGGVDYDDDFPGRGNDGNSEFFVYGAGDVGVEYNFDFPLLLSLDFRPEIGFNDFNDDVGFDIALGIRYQF